MDRERNSIREEFERIISKNLVKWRRLNKWLAEERLGKELIKKRIKKHFK